MYLFMYTSTIYINLYTSNRGGKICIRFYDSRCVLTRVSMVFTIVLETYKLIAGAKSCCIEKVFGCLSPKAR